LIKDYGDIPTFKINGMRHITQSAIECLCGLKWNYGVIDRLGKSVNITWRTLDSVNCEKCKELWMQINNKFI